MYKVLGELEAKNGSYTKARELFALGLSKDPHCAPVYHAAAMLEAKFGNLKVRCYMICLFVACFYNLAMDKYSYLVRSKL